MPELSASFRGEKVALTTFKGDISYLDPIKNCFGRSFTYYSNRIYREKMPQLFTNTPAALYQQRAVHLLALLYKRYLSTESRKLPAMPFGPDQG
ncbi:hypothetical protein NPIL_107851 [Nephila pilipes]|uniref:Uncharacterized protein n=1 Tax=Nephila pilipes TaxID=299642 RepID=A0A8X6QZ91_NEPPI|nr:hypothetical protein NPIL_107851 [Nephila pilipes]